MRSLIFLIVNTCVWTFTAHTQVLMPDEECISHVTLNRIEGSSLEGILHAGDTVLVQWNYYACHPVLKNDIVVFEYAAVDKPIIKKVAALQGDTLSWIQEGNEWMFAINGQLYLTPQGLPFRVSDREAKLLRLYLPSLHNRIPAQQFLVLGTYPGMDDSFRFGLIHRKSFKGRVVVPSTK